jgi:hypothetical protein
LLDSVGDVVIVFDLGVDIIHNNLQKLRSESIRERSTGGMAGKDLYSAANALHSAGAPLNRFLVASINLATSRKSPIENPKLIVRGSL